MSTCKILSFCDFISQQPSLTIFGKARYQNTFGGILSLLSVFVILAISSYLTSQVINRTSVQIIYNEESDDNPSINITGMPFAMGLYGATQAVPQKGIYSVSSLRYVIREVFINGQSEASISIEPVKLVNCSEADFSKWNYLKKDITNIQEKICFDPNENLEINGVYGSGKNNTFIYLKVEKCVNSTENNNECYPSEYINNVTQRVGFVYDYPNYFINNKNATQAGQFTMGPDIFYISSTIPKVFTHSYRNVEYTTDQGFVFEDLFTENFFIREQLTSDIQMLGDYLPLLEFQITTIAAKKDSYTRTYLKFQNLLANIGGVAKSVLVISQTLSIYFFDYIYYLALGNSLALYSHEKETNTNSTTTIQKINIINIKNPISNPTPIIYGERRLSLRKPKSEEVNPGKSILSATLSNFLLKKLCFRNQGSYNNIDKIIDYLNKKLSVDEICKKLYEFDKIKFILLNKEALNLLNYVPGPKINYDGKGQPLQNIEDLWRNFEFPIHYNNDKPKINLTHNIENRDNAYLQKMLQFINQI